MFAQKRYWQNFKARFLFRLRKCKPLLAKTLKYSQIFMQYSEQILTSETYVLVTFQTLEVKESAFVFIPEIELLLKQF